MSVGKRIRCPKCTQVFAVPDGADSAPSARRSLPTKRQTDGSARDGDVKTNGKERPRVQKAARRKVGRRNQFTLALVGGGAVLLLGGGVLVAVVRPWESRKAVASTNPPAASTPRPDLEAERNLPKRERGAQPETSQPNSAEKSGRVETSLPAGDGKGESESARLAAGRRVYETLDCSRCHALGGGSAGGQRKGRGPDLSRVGADPAHDAEWLSQQIRNPRSHRPGSRMPGYEGKINADDLRKMAEYLASLK
jgi:mono/diheme cytochrome c family protein